jgi:HK97 family phage major capsid protein
MAILEFLEARAHGAPTEKPSARVADRRPITKAGGAIAVLPMYGVIAQRMDLMMAYCGGVSTEAFADAFDAAMGDPNVSAIVIDCDSPGGNVQGTPELAKRILAARGKGKKIVAVANGTMASAAYWICSAADEIVATPSGDVGSIGVFCVHVDQSAMNEMIGLKYTLVKAGDHKAESNPWEELSPEAEAFMQTQVDEMNALFVSTIAKQRGTDVKTVNADYGQGRCFTAKQALAAGMIDRIATLEETLNRLGATNVGASGRPKALGDVDTSLQADDAAPRIVAEADDETDDDDDVCPDCGGALDDDGDCTTCDFTATREPASAAVAAGVVLPPAAGAVDTGQTLSPDQRPHAAEHLMDEALKAALEAERKRAADIRALARDHTIDEATIDAMVNSGASLDAASTQILAAVKGRHTASPNISVGADRAAERPFNTLGEQIVAVIQAGKPDGRRDPRLNRVNAQALTLVAGSPSGMNESVGSEGGFFIQNDLLPNVMEPIYADDPILSRVTRIPIGQGKNGIKYNVVDETDRRDGSRWGGIQMIWGDEADTPAAKKPKLRQVEQALKKLIGLAYLTDELMEDAPGAEMLLSNAFQAETKFMITSGIFRGPGGGQMLGFLNSKAVASVAIEATQTIANTAQFIGLNVTKMLSRIPAGLWDDVIFLYNQELLPYLVNATIGSGGVVPLFVGAGGLANRPFDSILGRPAFASEQCEAVGTPGDIIAVSPSQYHIADKGGPNQAMSLHVRFLYDEQVLRITQRIDGKPVWNTTVTPYKGANSRAPFVTVAVRA